MSDTRLFAAAATTTVSALLHDIWAVYVDVNGWPTWDEGLEKAQLHGNFRAGNGFTLKPEHGDPIDATLVSVTGGEEFTDEVTLPFGTIRTQHRLAQVGELVAITHEVRAEIAAEHAELFGTEIWPHLQGGLTASLDNLADVVRD